MQLANALVRLLEIDLRLTKDMHLVIMHDSTVDRTTNGTGEVSEMTLEEIKQLDAAHNFPELRDQNIKVPTFEEFLEIFIPYPDLLFMFDFKDELAVQKTMEVVNQRNIGNRFALTQFPVIFRRMVIKFFFNVPLS